MVCHKTKILDPFSETSLVHIHTYYVHVIFATQHFLIIYNNFDIYTRFEILKKKKIEAMRKRYEMNYTQCEPKAQRIKHIVDNEEIDAEEDAEIDFEQDLAKYFPQEIQKPVVQKIEECVNQERLVIKKEIGIQAWFNELPKPECSKLFLCHTISVGNINHSEIQVYIPNETGSLRIIRPQGMVDKCCGPEIIYVDKLIGTDENNFDYYSSYSDSCEE